MIYIVSPNDDRNYGAVLQATALQRFVGELGYDSRFIILKKNINAMLDRKYNTPKNIIKSLFVTLHGSELRRGCRAFDDFIGEHQKCTPEYPSYDALCTDPPSANVYIVGSDQVWVEANMLPLNFLTFAPDGAVKLSYAASLGKSTISAEHESVFREYLTAFTAVSLREESAIDAVRRVYDGDICCNIDPTMLYTAEHWRGYEREYRGDLPEKYILVYAIFVSDEMNGFLKSVRKKLGLPVVLVSNTPFKTVVHDVYIRDAGPGEFLYLINRAECVVSSSFHGTVFSVIFGKPFVAINNPSKPARLTALLSSLGMSERTGLDTGLLQRKPNDDMAKLYLQTERRKSAEYLKRYVGNAQ